MSTTLSPFKSNPRHFVRALVLSLVVGSLGTSFAFAQTSLLAEKPAVSPAIEASLALPESPGSVSSSLAPAASEPSLTLSPVPRFDASFQSLSASRSSVSSSSVSNEVVAGRLTKIIQPDQQAPTLRIGDKVLLGFKDSISPISSIGWAAAAGYSQAVNGSPNYGTNGKAYAQRLGAAAARSVSQAVFTDSVMAPILREDPRYYRMGKSHKLLTRIAYAATRPLITRTDGGRQTVNLSYLSGNLAGAALTQAYYPPVNRGFSQVMQTWGGSIGGGAIGFISSEFLSDLLQAVHLQNPK